MSRGRWSVILAQNWRLLVTLLSPIIFTLVPIYWKGVTGKEPYAAYTILLMSSYWMTECIPLSITSFLPVLLYPLFGIVSSEKISSAYLQDSILFLFGGCVIALSFEYCNLHTRIALKVIMVVGARISQLMFGIMMTTMFLSMWMNNTSTCAMMVPIVNAIMEELKKKLVDPPDPDPGDNENEKEKGSYEEIEGNGKEMDAFSNQVIELRSKDSSNVLPFEFREKSKAERLAKVNAQIRNLKVMFLLATAYSANIGGTGVITGSGTNVVALDLVRKDAEEAHTPPECKKLLQISFLDWMMFNIPPMILNTILCWGYLQVHFLGLPSFLVFWRKNKGEDELSKLNKTLEKSVKSAIKIKYAELGPITFHEIGILIHFVLIVLLWIFKDPQFIPGWDSLPFFARNEKNASMIKECTPTLLICFSMFIIPGKSKYYKNFFKGGLGAGMKDTLLSWEFIFENFPWGIFILLGGGSAMAVGAKESGLNKWIEEILSKSEFMKQLPGPVLLIVVLHLIACLTAVASNTACAAIVTPVLLGVSYVKNLHPLYLVYAATTVCSYAFVLPVSTPPNAIVYSASDLKLQEMIKPGLLFNVICIAVLFLTTHTTSSWIFNFGGYDGQCSNMTLGAEMVPNT